MAVVSMIVYLFLPPTGLALVALLALFIPGRLGKRVAAVLLAVLLALATPLVAETMLAALDPPRPVQPVTPEPGAIVILSGDVARDADGQADVGMLTLERERAGAALARQTGLPVLVTGGAIEGAPPLGVMMATSLRRDFGVPVRWAETRSQTTWENAEFSAPLLKAAGITRVYLVSHAWHLRRAAVAFRRFGIETVPAPVRWDRMPDGTLWDLEPRTTAWMLSYYAIHEWIGLLWYSVHP